MDKSQIKIMVVDDESGILDSLKTHFELDGYKVTTHSSARAALEQFRKSPPHIVFSDINMPDMDGLEFLEALRKNRMDTLVVMITAYTSIAKVLSSRLFGAFDYILKPFMDLGEVDRVMDKCARHIERWEAIFNETKEEKRRKKVV